MRLDMRRRIAELDPDRRAVADKAVCRRLSSLAADLEFAIVLGYLALPDEVRVEEFLSEMTERGKRILVPRVHAGSLLFAHWHPGVALSRDEKGVLAPAQTTSMPKGSALVLVPGRAFDAAGRRLGRGGGYYDALLALSTGAVIHAGISYESQVVESVPFEDHDRRVDIVVTDSRLITAPAAIDAAERQ